jgi:2-oxoglutarate-Fe(II)-dependent oxygenase superfamily protein
MNPEATNTVAESPARRWRADSPLDRISRRQNTLNELGRARITGGGGLRGCDEMKKRPLPADLHCLILEDFLDGKICDRLCQAFRDLSTRIVNRIPGFWDGRFLWHSDMRNAYGELADHMRNAQRAATARVTEFYGLTEPIYPDLLQMMSWPVGIHMPPHADNANPDGSPHAMAHRDFSGIIYLNDDYRGGEFYFTARNTLITPRKGMLLAFTAGFYHEHAVLRVEGKERLTMPFFLTFDKTRADPSLL